MFTGIIIPVSYLYPNSNVTLNVNHMLLYINEAADCTLPGFTGDETSVGKPYKARVGRISPVRYKTRISKLSPGPANYYCRPRMTNHQYKYFADRELMAGDQKSTGDRYETGENNGLAHHLVAIFAAAVVILVIAGGIILSEAGKNPAPVPAKTPGERDILYQVSTIDALDLGCI